VGEALDVLNGYDLWPDVAASIRAHLSSPQKAESPALNGTDIHTVMMVTGQDACVAMTAAVERDGWAPVILGTFLQGEGRHLGGALAGVAKECVCRGRPFARRSVLVACGGEATVSLGPQQATFGDGGPNQEVALGAALQLGPGERVAIACVDTDGRDGSTPYAGAVVDGLTLARARDLGLSLKAALLEHRTSAPLKCLGDLIVTGSTGTNVNDMLAIAVG